MASRGTDQGVGRRVVILTAVLVVAFPAGADEKLLTAYAGMATAKTVTSYADNLCFFTSAYFLTKE